MSGIQALDKAVAAAAASAASVADPSHFSQRARFEINEAGRYLLAVGVLSPGHSFNAAIRVPGEEKFVLGGFTPAGEALAPAAVIGFDGRYYEGKFKPSHLELIEVYAAIFNGRPDVNAAIHTHSPQLESFAIAQHPLPIAYGSALLRLTDQPIPVTPWEPRYSAQPIVDAIRENPATPAILVGNHGPFVWGESIQTVARLVVTLEEAAGIILNAQILGGARPFPDGARAALVGRDV